MTYQFKNKKISSLVSIVPRNVRKFDDDVSGYNFPIEKSIKLKKLMGYEERRIATPDVTASDMVKLGFEHLFLNDSSLRERLDALIFVSHTPDHVIPPTSSILHGKLGLNEDCLCFDINQGCTGFVLGLLQAAMLLDNDKINTVALCTGDTFSRNINKRDRNSYPLVGDAASVTIVETADSNENWTFLAKNRGKDANALIIPAGGSRMPSTLETRRETIQSDGNIRSLENLTMDGAAVFNFVMSEVPIMIEELLVQTSTEIHQVDAFCLHQPNRFLLEKVAQKMDIDEKRMPRNIVEKYGNSNSSTIPVNICENFGNLFKQNKTSKALICGFGVGLSWAAGLLDLNGLQVCEIIEV